MHGKGDQALPHEGRKYFRQEEEHQRKTSRRKSKLGNRKQTVAHSAFRIVLPLTGGLLPHCHDRGREAYAEIQPALPCQEISTERSDTENFR